MNKKKLFKIFAINLLILVVLILSVEGISRLVAPEAETQALFSDPELRVRGRPFVELNPARGFALKPNFSNDFYSINKDGFRGENFPADLDNRLKILAMGESTTFGWAVRDEETWPAYLMARFDIDGSSAYVINGGIPSYTSSQVLAYLKEIIEKQQIRPDIVLINILWNDIWYSTVSNWHPDILIFQKPPQWMTFLAAHSRFIRGMIMGFGSGDERVNIPNHPALVQYGKNIEEMVELCQQHGIEVVLIEPPFDGDHMPESGMNDFHIRYTKDFFLETARKYTGEVREIAKRYDAGVVDHRLDLTNLHQQPLFLDPLHPTPEGNAMMAEDIYNYLVRTRLAGKADTTGI